MQQRLALGVSVIVFLALVPTRAPSQASPRSIRGIVVASNGLAIPSANVFVLETLEGVVTGADGRFQLNVSDSGATLVARSLGYTPFTLKLQTPLPDSVVITLDKAAPALTPITVMASSYTASEERTATLTPLEVVTIPGTAADVNRALQTLPGIQQVDEGTGLFVRGGDAYETKVFLNDAELLNPMDIQSPNGTFMGTVDPFLLDGIVFSSGGFGARYGNALSAAVSLETQGRPSRRALSASAGLAGVSISAGQPANIASGIRVAANLFDLRPLIALNGSSREYDPAPHGHDLSASVTALSPRFGELKIFAIQQTSSLGVGVTAPGFDGTFAMWSKNQLAVANWHRESGPLSTTLAASVSSSAKNETYGTFDLGTRLGQAQLFAEQEWTRNEYLTIRGGGEIDHTRARFEGSIPNTDIDVAPGSRTRVIESSESGDRIAAFLEADTRLLSRLRLVTGLRGDRSTLTGEATLDPRISLAFRAKGSAHVTAAWGVYHQIPDPLLFDSVLGNSTLSAMRATHSILGFQAGDNSEMIRVELYRKEYDNLTRQTRDYSVATGLTGSSYGADFFVKGSVLGTRGRVTYSYSHSTRLDAETRIGAASPFDVPHTLTAVIQRSVGGLELGGAYRRASGRPFTPVIEATFNAADNRWVPTYGAPSSERLPDLERVDLSVSRMQRLLPGWQVVAYASVNNVLGRHNVYDYTWSADYKRRIPVASLFDRSLYVGATIIH